MMMINKNHKVMIIIIIMIKLIRIINKVNHHQNQEIDESYNMMKITIIKVVNHKVIIIIMVMMVRPIINKVNHHQNHQKEIEEIYNYVFISFVFKSNANKKFDLITSQN